MKSRGRPTRNTGPLQVRLSLPLLAEIKTQFPTLLKPGQSQFRHGALSAWLENLLWKELRGKAKYVQGQTIRGSVVGQRPPEAEFSSGDPLGQDLHLAANIGGRDSLTGGELGSPENSSQDPDIQYGKAEEWRDP